MDLYRPLQAGSLRLSGNLFLAPVAGYSDRAFRSICISAGADFTCTELISSEALVRDSEKTVQLLLRAENELQYAIQLFGSDPEIMAAAATRLAPYGPAAVDINCGCPVPKVIKTGSGSALLKNPDLLSRIVEAVCEASEKKLNGIPVTVKIRSGWDAQSINYLQTAAAAVKAGAALVGLHARTRAQAYSGKADWNHIADLAAYLDVPVIGSGDLFSPESASDMLRRCACSGVMFARGAMGNPFIFSQTRSLLCSGSYQDVDPQVKLRTGFKQLCMLSRDIGEHSACREMRKHFCSYTKGLKGGASLRNQLVHAESIQDYRSKLEKAGIVLSDISC